MRKLLLSCVVFLCLHLSASATGDEDSLKVLAEQMKAYEQYLDSIENTLNYETGAVMLPGGKIKLNVPAGFKYLNAEQSKFILTDLWENPPREDVLGMIFPATSTLSDENSYAFIISFDPIGYVKDKDADDINYDDLMKEMKKEEATENTRRESLGYDAIHMIGWAQQPYYDKVNKVLHWAKELRFGQDEYSTLNYDVRILGRHGVLSMNAIGTMETLPAVKKDIDKVLLIPSFTDGNRYQDFDSKTDEVAAWTVGGLVAGKVLAKAGAFKFLKIIIIGLIAAIGGAWKWISGRKKKNEFVPESIPTTHSRDTPIN